jgi:hypothetical protein
MKSLGGLAAVLLIVSGCSSKAAQPEKQPASASESDIETLMLQPATVTEVFHLRGECVTLGKKVEEDMSKYLKEGEYVVSTRINYNVGVNHCYVLLVKQSESQKLTSLYDGQTEEMLAAFAKNKDGSPSRGFIGHTPDGTLKLTDYAKATDYINGLMGGDEPKE